MQIEEHAYFVLITWSRLRFCKHFKKYTCSNVFIL